MGLLDSHCLLPIEKALAFMHGPLCDTRKPRRQPPERQRAGQLCPAVDQREVATVRSMDLVLPVKEARSQNTREMRLRVVWLTLALVWTACVARADKSDNPGNPNHFVTIGEICKKAIDFRVQKFY